MTFQVALQVNTEPRLSGLLPAHVHASIRSGPGPRNLLPQVATPWPPRGWVSMVGGPWGRVWNGDTSIRENQRHRAGVHGRGRAPEFTAGRGGCVCWDQEAWPWEGPAAAQGTHRSREPQPWHREGDGDRGQGGGRGGGARRAVAGDGTRAGRTDLEAGGGPCGESYVSSSWVLSCCINAPGFQILRTPFLEELFKLLWFKI